jgi:group I intron endonuclease
VINNKIYIGQSQDCYQRWRQHKLESTKDNPAMIINRSMKKYGINNFIFEVIACCKTLEDANYIETLLIDQYQSHISMNKGYNVSLGGNTSPKSEDWKQKVSQKLMGHEVSQETRDKVSKGNTGKIRSLETKQQISQSMIGKNRSEEHKNNLSEALKGNKNCLGNIHSDETKQKISKANKGKRPSDVTIARAVEKTKGKTWKVIDGKRVWIDK